MAKWGPKEERKRTKPANWQKVRQWNAEAVKSGIRPRVFCASLADVFDNAVPAEWRTDLFQLIRETPMIDWLLLTKRVGNVRKMLPAGWGYGWPNVWLGITVVNQEEATRDIPKLLEIPSFIKFLSMEPLLGPVDLLADYLIHEACRTCADYSPDLETNAIECRRCECSGKDPEHVGIDWVIVGGESGNGSRPMDPLWATSLRDQCEKAGVAFMFKQWGNILPASWDGEDHRGRMAYIIDEEHRGVDFDELGTAKYLEAHGREFAVFNHKKTGRLLDGRTWDGVPN